LKQLDRLLLFQGNRCFFCDEPIPDGEASVEHLVAASVGGSNDDDNCVACCKTLNAAFGNRPYKDKLRAVVVHRGPFVCPRNTSSSRAEAALNLSGPAEAANGRLAVVIADLQRRGTARPRKVETLKNTISSVFQKQLSDLELNSLFMSLLATGYVILKESNVSYNLPPDA
jgi:septum formation topological specificity factor MinE